MKQSTEKIIREWWLSVLPENKNRLIVSVLPDLKSIDASCVTIGMIERMYNYTHPKLF